MTQSVTDVQTLLPELAQLVVSAVNLEVDPASIDPDAPLYREGLGLDSIDILEISCTHVRHADQGGRCRQCQDIRLFAYSGAIHRG